MNPSSPATNCETSDEKSSQVSSLRMELCRECETGETLFDLKSSTGKIVNTRKAESRIFREQGSGFFLSGSLSSHSSPVPESSASSEGLEQSRGLLGREDEVRGRGRGGNLVKIKGETVENLDNEEDDEAIADNALSLVMKLGGLLMAAIFPVYFFCSVTVVESPHVIEEEDMEMKIGFLRRRFATLHRHGEGTNVDRGLPILVPGSSYTQTVLPRTLQTRVEHVSSDNMDCTEGTGNMGILSDMSNDDCDEPKGLIVLEQKRRRVEDTGPIQEPNPIQEPTAMHAKAVSIVASKSDHMPLYLELQPHSFVRHKGRFRFENMWLRDSMCREIMIESWSRTTGQHLLDRVERGGKAIWNWGKSFAKDFSKRLQYWRNRMEITKGRRDPRGIILYKEAQEQYIRALHHQNDYWRQRAKQFWLQSGDTNSAYFHNSVRRRRQNNRITRLRDEDGNWVDRVNHHLLEDLGCTEREIMEQNCYTTLCYSS
nr:uncharacterized protein LOC109184133 isoform X2 [Ipomoea batatas]